MKNITSISKIAGLLLLLVGLTWSCREGIDAITAVDPGPDQGAPEVTIQFPVDGSKIKVLEAITSVNVKFEATDDIELQSVKVTFDGAEIASFSDFKDYRRYLGNFDYDQVSNGVHQLAVIATDLSGKSTTATVSFEKEAPYTPVYDGEVLYMPFDNEYIDLVSITRPTIVGNPGFADEGLVGTSAYKGAENAYLTFPTDAFKNQELSAVFWMKVNSSPDRAGVLVMGPPDAVNPDAANNRTSGFRFFRENAGGMQRFKLNVGNGSADSWFDGGAAADVAPNTGEWVHFAFTISGTEAVVYIDGEVVKQGAFTGVDWTGCDVLSIMSGAPRFTGWNHLSDQSIMDELRIFDRALTQTEIKGIIEDESGRPAGYTPKYDGETFYMSFDDEFSDEMSGTTATVVGTPGFSDDAKSGKSFAGAADSYLSFPTDGLTSGEFSAVFWYKPNSTPDRAGILVMGPPDPDKPNTPNNRKKGFRFFREGSATSQIFKLNVGTGDSDSWFDGGATATVDVTSPDWVHLAFTISGTEGVVYINGEVVKQGDLSGIDWTDCDILSIGSGAPRFTEWNHLSDLSLYDELRFFNKALTQAEIQQIIADEQ